MRSVRGADGVTLVRSAWGGSWSAQSVVERGVHRFSTQVVKRLEPTLVWFSRQLLCCRITAVCQWLSEFPYTSGQSHIVAITLRSVVLPLLSVVSGGCG